MNSVIIDRNYTVKINEISEILKKHFNIKGNYIEINFKDNDGFRSSDTVYIKTREVEYEDGHS